MTGVVPKAGSWVFGSDRTFERIASISQVSDSEESAPEDDRFSGAGAAAGAGGGGGRDCSSSVSSLSESMVMICLLLPWVSVKALA